MHDITKKQSLLTLRIIWFAMIQGVLFFAGIIWFMSRGNNRDEASVLVYVGLAAACLAVVLQFAVPGFIRARAIRDINRNTFENTAEDDRWQLFMPAYRTGEIIAFAMLEGAGFCNVLMWFLTGSSTNLCLFGAVLFLLLLRFPSTGKFDNWADSQSQLMQLKM